MVASFSCKENGATCPHSGPKKSGILFPIEPLWSINKLNSKGNYFFYILCGPNEREISKTIIDSTNSEKCLSFSEKTVGEIIPIMSSCNLYIGNDSFGHHVCSQSGIPSIILMLDTPSAYSDYSINQHRVLPDGVNINEVDHNSAFSVDQIAVDKVYNKALSLIR